MQQRPKVLNSSSDEEATEATVGGTERYTNIATIHAGAEDNANTSFYAWCFLAL